jgi:hypothetical protein
MASVRETPSEKLDPGYLKYASERQAEIINAINFTGSGRKAADKLGVHHSNVNRAVAAVKKKAAAAGFSPEHDMLHTVPEGFSVKGVSTLYNEDGKAVAQWVKSRKEDSDAEETLREFIAGLAEPIKGKAPNVKPPKLADEDLLAVYPMGDPHFGMLAMAAECGEDFRLEDAVDRTRAAFDRLVDAAPPAHTALIAELGDFFHSDNEQNRTARSGAALDTSNRWAEVLQAGLHTMIYCVQKCRSKHKKVIVRIVRGNHDTHSSFALSLALAAYFHDVPGVEIVVDPASYWYFEFGAVLIGLTHGDGAKMTDLAGIMSVDCREAWGRTVHRYWYQGHIHNKQMRELYGAMAESFRTLAGKDAWHSAEGYRSGSDMHLIVHHRKYGEWQRSRVDVGLLLEDIKIKKAA